jgi:hypothetical protein
MSATMKLRGLLVALVPVAVLAAFACVGTDPAEPPPEAPETGTPDGSGQSDAQPGDGAYADVADAGPPPPLWIFAGSSAGKTEVVLARPDATKATIVGDFTLPTDDAVAYASGGRAFVLNRKNGDVFVLDEAQPEADNKVVRVATGGDGGVYDSNPYAVTVVSATKAYVVRYGSNKMMIVDLTPGTVKVSGTIDLAPLVAPGDPDGRVEMAAAQYVSEQDRVYVALQRIDSSVFPTATCQGGSALVAIDTKTDKIVDLDANGSPGIGDLFLLNGQNPQEMVLDRGKVPARLLVRSIGCSNGGAPIAGDVIEEVVLSSALAKQTLLPSVGPTVGMLYVSPKIAFVQLAANNQWKKWDPTTTTLGADVTQFPSVPFVDPTGIAGLQDDTPAGAFRTWSIYRTDFDGQINKRVAENPFTVVRAPNIFLLSSARVR